MDVSVEHTGGPVRLRDLRPEDEPAVLDLFGACSDWFRAAFGQPSGPGDVQSLYYALPEGCAPDQKRLLVAETADDGVAALIDLVLGHPSGNECTVGAFLVAPACRHQGLGTALARTLREEAAHRGIVRVHTTVTDGWESGTAFLRALGFHVSEAAVAPGGNRNLGPGERGVRRATLSLQSAPAAEN